MSTRGDMRKLVRAAIARGWKIVPAVRRNHTMLEFSNGKRVTVSDTPSDHHAYMNARKDFERAEK